jgi:hypothetical protein
MSGGAIKHSFSVRGLSAEVTQEALSAFFTSIGASVASIRMVPAIFFFWLFFLRTELAKRLSGTMLVHGA